MVPIKWVCGITIFILCIYVANAHAVNRTISWSAVTTYTDNTLIEPTKTVYYTIKMDNTVLVDNTTATSFVFPQTDENILHVFVGKARLSTGEESAWSPPYSWTSPIGGIGPGPPGLPIILNIGRP